MTALKYRTCLLSLLLIAAPLQAALGQAKEFEGAWLEDGSSCADVFVATRGVLAFKRPANAFTSAFIIRGKRLTTPMASCELIRVERRGDRQALQMSCATAIAVDRAHAFVAMRGPDRLARFSAGEGGLATEYQRCTAETLKAP